MAVRPTSFDARTEHNGRSLSQSINVKSPRIIIRCVLNLHAGGIAGGGFSHEFRKVVCLAIPKRGPMATRGKEREGSVQSLPNKKNDMPTFHKEFGSRTKLYVTHLRLGH